jgi:hypothetical protein
MDDEDLFKRYKAFWMTSFRELLVGLKLRLRKQLSKWKKNCLCGKPFEWLILAFP